MFDMLVEQRTTPPGHHTIHHHNHSLGHHHNEMAQDLSPGRSLASSSMSSKASSTGSNSSETPLKDTSESFEDHPSPKNIRDTKETKQISEDFSALQRLQFALEKNILFSGLFSPESETSDVNSGHPPKLVKDEPLSPPSFQHHEAEDKNGGLGDKSLESPGSTSPLMMHSDPSEDPANIFQCPLCSVVCNSRHSFNEHLVIHTQQMVCPKCTFFTDDEEKLNSHIKESHDMTEFETLSDEEEVRNPKVNSQGKVKTFKCKQCQYVTVTKADFWAHSKSHIREEKMLNCPKCPFVTEYKHHLEYHLRNHFNSKPFQCTKCSYTCVNKSMLNSHLKSHSNVYQYRCADCSYATKYCHSLKLHLRKYSHNPSMVLNADGSPNPLPIIDVYGTRRGPKVKKGEPTTASVLAALDAMEGQQQLSPNGSLSPPSARNHNNNKIKAENPLNAPQQQQKVKRKKKAPKQIPNSIKSNGGDGDIPMMMAPNRILSTNNNIYHSSASDEDSDNESESMKIRINHQLPVQQLMNGAMRSPNDQPNNSIIDPKNPLQLYAAYLSSINQGYNPYMNSVAQQHYQRQQEFVANQQQQQQMKLLSQLQLMSQAQAQASQNQVNNLPYNLSTSPNSHKQPQQHQHPPQLNNRVQQQQQQQQEHNQAPLDLRASVKLPSTNCGEDLKKRKRKGKAIKRYDANNDHMDDDDDHWNHEDLDENIVLDFSNNNLSREKFQQSLVQTQNHGQHRIISNRVGNASTSPSALAGQLMTCKYCEISFPDRVLYSMHMSYHSGDSNPFLCKSCGKKSDNKTAFFLHLTTDSH